MTEPLIRPFQAWDIGPVSSLVRTVLATLQLGADVGGLGVDVNATGRDPLAPDAHGDHAATWVIEGDDGVVGTLSVGPQRDQTCVLRRLYLLPEYHGRGWGTMALRHALDWAGQVGYTEMQVTLDSAMERASRLLIREGFQPKETSVEGDPGVRQRGDIPQTQVSQQFVCAVPVHE